MNNSDMPQKKKSRKSGTPLMEQYQAIKAQHRDKVVFFRMGDFYEMFNEDAKVGARILGITLTSRGHGRAGEVPLAGFPHHALDGYLAKMIRAGYRVAICEQVEDPKLAKGIVKRDVVQVVTPGTTMADDILENRSNNFLSAAVVRDGVCGFASADVSTGEFIVTECEIQKLGDTLVSISPSELVVETDQAEEIEALLIKTGPLPVITKQDAWIFGKSFGQDILKDHFKTASLKGFGCEGLDAGIMAAGAVLHYLKETQKTDLSHISRLVHYGEDGYMHLDAATRRNLEITASLMGGDSGGTLISIIDRTSTAMGARTLKSWIRRPLNRLDPIRERLDAVEVLLDRKDQRDAILSLFRGMGDLERLITKVVTHRAMPRDLAALKQSLERIPDFKKQLEDLHTSLLSELNGGLEPTEEVTDRIAGALVDDPPPQLSDGGFIREGYDTRLDELRAAALSGKDWIVGLQSEERKQTGIPSLKVGYNKIFGYYIEVTNPHLEKVPASYIRKQTLVNAERYITPDLKEMEEKILHAEEEMTALEYSLFDALRSHIAGYASQIQMTARMLGRLPKSFRIRFFSVKEYAIGLTLDSD